MAYKPLTADDVLQDTIDARAFTDEPAKVSNRDNNRIRRVLTGDYIGQVSRYWLREIDKGAHEGRRYASLLVKLFSEDEKFKGTTFVQVSWHYVTKVDGSLDLMSKLFGQLVRVLGAPNTAKPTEVIEAAQDEYFSVYVKEYFNVPVSRLFDKLYKDECLAKGLKPDYTVYDFINKDDEEKVKYYLKLELESKGMVLSLDKLTEAV